MCTHLGFCVYVAMLLHFCINFESLVRIQYNTMECCYNAVSYNANSFIRRGCYDPFSAHIETRLIVYLAMPRACQYKVTHTRPRSAMDKEPDCKSRGREFDPCSPSVQIS